jgi:opacity protein-like surface antigen
MLFGAGASFAEAQDAGWTQIAVSASKIDYDLAGVGSTPGLAVRATRALTPGVAVELRGLFAVPELNFGRSTLFIPEAHLQYHWNLGRFSPYVGGGIGTALVKSRFHTDWDVALSTAVGTSVRLTDRVGLTGELRLRGHEMDFAGSTAEFSVGLAWRLPAL